MTAPGRRAWRALAVLCLGNFLILLDTSIVNTALPDMTDSLNAGIDEALWVLNGYLLAFAALLVVCSRLGDLFGPRRMFVAGLVVFSVASALCAAAGTAGQLVAARVLQGIGAAMLLPQALTLIAGLFPADRRGPAFGVFTAVAGLAAVSGPTVGGLIVTNLGWQWIFLMNVPLGLAGVLAALILVPGLRQPRPPGIDLAGVVLATGGLLLLVYALVEGERHHWGRVAGPVSIPVVLVAAVLLLIAFAVSQRSRANALVPPALFRDRRFAVGTTLTLLTSFALYGFLLVFVIETQTMLGMSPTVSGLTALPWTIALSAVAPVAGRFTDRLGGRRLLLAGLLVYAAGIIGVALLPGAASGPAAFAAPLVLVGIGMGCAIAPTTTESMRTVSAPLAGAASGVLNTARQVGAVLGAAVTGAILQHSLTSSLHDTLSQDAARLPASLRRPMADGFAAAGRHGLQLGVGRHGGVATPPGLSPEQAHQYQAVAADVFGRALLSAAQTTLLVVAGVLVLGAALATLLPRRAAGDARPAPLPERAERV